MAIPATAVDAGGRAVVVRVGAGFAAGCAGAAFGGVVGCGAEAVLGVAACAISKLNSNSITIRELYEVQVWARTATYNRQGRQGYL
jgi:hypothetical protein